WSQPGTVEDPPGAVVRSPDREVALPVTLEIIRADLERVPVDEGGRARVCRGNVVGDPPLLDAHARAAADDPPIAVGRPPDRDVGPAVAVVVTRHRNVALHSPLLDRLRSSATGTAEPIAGSSTPGVAREDTGDVVWRRAG